MYGASTYGENTGAFRKDFRGLYKSHVGMVEGCDKADVGTASNRGSLISLPV